MSAKPDGFNQGMFPTMCHQAPAAQNPQAAFAEEQSAAPMLGIFAANTRRRD